MKWIAALVVLSALTFVAYLAFRNKEPHPNLTSSYVGRPNDYEGDKTLLVVVKAKWAGVWRATGEVLADLDEEKYDITIIDADSDPKIAKSLNVSIIPTVIAYRHGEEVSRHPNLMSADQLP